MTLKSPADVTEDQTTFRFADMHLQPGDRLQIHNPGHADRTRHISRVVGFAEGVSLLVTVPVTRGVRAEFIENEVVVVQAFSRNSAFAFKSSVLNVCRRPFDYMHLSFPDRIQGNVIRSSERVRVAIPAQAITVEGEEIGVRLGNLSATGALVIAPQRLGEVGRKVRVSFSVDLHGVLNDIGVDAPCSKSTKMKASGSTAWHSAIWRRMIG